MVDLSIAMSTDGWLARSACWPVELVVWRTTENTGLHRLFRVFGRVHGSFSGGEVHGTLW